MRGRLGRTAALAGLAASFLFAQPDIQQIVRRSVAANEADWKAVPEWAFVERDVTTKGGGSREVRTYEVLIIDGSPYERPLKINDRPLTPAQDAAEQKKLRQEVVRRQHQSARVRARRIAKYRHERQQDHAMLREMIKAFDFRLAGEGQLNGHDVYIVRAVPRPDYEPSSRETRVLTGMKGTMWIDKQTYQWVKVEAEVFQPVSFGFFIAKVGPGTRFILEQAPVSGSLWLPTHFEMQVKATILWAQHNSTDDETYRDYRPMNVVAQEFLRGSPALNKKAVRSYR